MSQKKFTPQEVADKISDADEAFHSLGIELISAVPGKAKMSMKVRPNMLNCLGILHGGILFSLADTALAFASNVDNVVSYTYSSTIYFLSSVSVGEEIIAVTEEDNTAAEDGTKSGRTSFYTTTVFGKDMRRVAVVQGVTRSVDETVIDVIEQAKP
ncbi:MAG: hotdog fold thioesterase [Kordiimonadaceae bacterium]|nr:hotdog fold thioesterase [Kordiimonadaceae bacterium]